MTIVLPVALAAVVAFLVSIAPLTSAITVLSGATTTTEKVVTDIKSDVAKHGGKGKKAVPKPMVVKQ